MQLKRKRKYRYHEDALQETCNTWLRYKFPNLVFFAIPNGGRRNPFEMARMKLCGVLNGVPDTFLAHAAGGFHGLFIEFKSDSGRLSESQSALIPKIESEGYLVAVVRSFEEFERLITEYVRK